MGIQGIIEGRPRGFRSLGFKCCRLVVLCFIFRSTIYTAANSILNTMAKSSDRMTLCLYVTEKPEELPTFFLRAPDYSYTIVCHRPPF